MELAEAAQDLEENANCPSQLETAFLRSLGELRDLRNGRRLAPVSRRRCRPRLRLPGEGVGVPRLAHSGPREKVNPLNALNPFNRRAFAGGATDRDRPRARSGRLLVLCRRYCETQPFRR